MFVILHFVASQRKAAISITFCIAKLPETVLTKSHRKTVSELLQYQYFVCLKYTVVHHYMLLYVGRSDEALKYAVVHHHYMLLYVGRSDEALRILEASSYCRL
jgi:hypothetical protein